MEQNPPVPPPHKTQSPTQRQQAEALQAARRVANEERTIAGLKKRGDLQHRITIVPKEEEHVDGTKERVEVRRRVRLSVEERQQRATNYLTTVLGRSPTVTDYAAGASYYGLPDGDQQELDRAIKDALEGVVNEKPEPFFDALGRFGPRVLRDPELNVFVEGWWLAQTDYKTPTAAQDKAKQYLERIGTTLSIRKGRTREVTADVAQQMEKIYNEEYTRCCTVKELEKRPWKTPQERHRQIGDSLGISPEAAAELREEGLHLSPSLWARQRTTKKTGYSEETVRRTLLSRRRSRTS